MGHTNSLPTKLMLGVALVQGILLLALYRAFDANVWPSESPVWSYPFWTLAVAMPVLLLLSLGQGEVRRVVRLNAVVAAVLTGCALYTGIQATPYGEFSISNLTWIFVLTIGVACFKALMYLQQRAARVPLSYEVLFANSWRNFLLLALTCLFVLIFWLILVLWGQLFKVIGIKFFYRLFDDDWFLIPVLAVAFGVGIILFRNLTHVIDSITNLLRGLIKYLLPLVVAVAVMFILALPFTGLEVLWSTGHGTALLLWLMAAMLFFTNSVYQDGRELEPYPLFWHRFIYVGLLALPVLAALSFYGLMVRVDQHGLSVSRLWAWVVWSLLALFAIGYGVGIARRRDRWPESLARVNTVMGLVVMAVMLLANSPLLDFRKLSLRSQLALIESGEKSVLDFDYWYAKNSLARPGHLAIGELRQRYADNPKVIEKIDRAVRSASAQSITSAEEYWEALRYRPSKFQVPVELKGIIDMQSGRFPQVDNTIFQVDLDDDGVFEFVLISHDLESVRQSIFFYLKDQNWQTRYLNWHVVPDAVPNVENSLEAGKISSVPPRFKNLRIGSMEFETR